MASAPKKESQFALLNHHLITGRITRNEYQAACKRRAYVGKAFIGSWRGFEYLYPGRANDLRSGNRRAGGEHV